MIAYKVFLRRQDGLYSAGDIPEEFRKKYRTEYTNRPKFKGSHLFVFLNPEQAWRFLESIEGGGRTYEVWKVRTNDDLIAYSSLPALWTVRWALPKDLGIKDLLSDVKNWWKNHTMFVRGIGERQTCSNVYGAQYVKLLNKI